MKNIKNLKIYTIILTGIILIITSSCEKEEDFIDNENLPVVSTKEITEITANSAVSGGTITEQGGSEISERGIVWSTSSEPTIDNKSGITSDGNGTGSYTSNLTSLSSGVEYFVRAYATNSYGTSYGNELSFTTTSVSVEDVEPKLATGQNFSLALKKDGTVWAWGRNDRGQLGDGTKNNNPTPAQVMGLPPIVDIAATSRASYAVGYDGSLWIWGSTYDLNATDLGNYDALNPVVVPGISEITVISAGKLHVLAIDENKNLYAWGSGENGKLGHGGTDNRFSPVHITGISNVIEVSAGGEHSLALTNDGTVWAWGRNSSAELGNADGGISSIPIQVAGISNVIDIAATNSTFSMALKNDGTVWAWGQNQNGNPFGFGTQQNPGEGVGTYYSPVQTPFSDVKSIKVYDSSTIALKNDGTIWCAGFYSTSIGILPALVPNEHENISNIPHTNSKRLPIPTMSPHYSNVKDIGKPWGQGPGHIQFIYENGNVWGSGNNNYGQLGDGNTSLEYVRQAVKANIELPQ